MEGKMEEAAHLLLVDKKKLSLFFYSGLRDETERRKVYDDELLHVVSVLAHFVMTSRHDISTTPPPENLSEVFDTYILRIEETKRLQDVLSAGAQSLLLAVFFRDQMRRRHNVKWYDTKGSEFYKDAACLSKNPESKKVFKGMAHTFPQWTEICCSLSRTLRSNQEYQYYGIKLGEV